MRTDGLFGFECLVSLMPVAAGVTYPPPTSQKSQPPFIEKFFNIDWALYTSITIPSHSACENE